MRLSTSCQQTSISKLSDLYELAIAEERPQLWKPMAFQGDDSLGNFDFAGIARLKPGVSISQALADLNGVQFRLASEAPQKIDLRAALVPLQDQITGRWRTGLELLLAAVGAMLLVACVNITNLLLARTTARRREFAVRRALGASSARLIQQILVESLALSALGGACGTAIAYAAVRLIPVLVPAGVPRLDEVQVDARLLLFTFAVSTVIGLAVGVLPAWRFARIDLLEAMRSGSRSLTASRDNWRVRSSLVSVEVGLSAMCLIVGGLLLHSFLKLVAVDKGFDANRVVTMDLNLAGSRYSSRAKKADFLGTVLERVQALPGVTSVGVASKLPITGEGGNSTLSVEGTTVPLVERPLGDYRMVNPDYFRTMGIPLRAGRIFVDADRGRAVALVSRLAAERLWPGQNPIGKRFRSGTESAPLNEVVGVVGDVRDVSLDGDPSSTVYMPYWQNFAIRPRSSLRHRLKRREARRRFEGR